MGKNLLYLCILLCKHSQYFNSTRNDEVATIILLFYYIIQVVNFYLFNYLNESIYY